MTEKITGTTQELILNWARKIDSQISDLYEESDQNLPAAAKRPIISIQTRVKKLANELHASEINLDFLKNIQEISKRSVTLRALANKFAEEMDERGQLRLAMLSATVSQGGDLLLQLKKENPKAARQYDGLESLKNFEESLRNIDSRIKKNENLTRVTDERLDKISKDIKYKVDDLLASYANAEGQLSGRLQSADKTIEQIREKEEEVNKLVGIVSGKSIAGSYSESARAELALANSMRNGSVFLMLTISMLVGYSLIETSSPHFDWQTAIFRLIFSVALSVPAAYLSRESAKHRIKQYEFQKISLDLQSISPYLASLPLDEQHKLKSDMAGKIFTPVATKPQQESYPIDIQSLLHKIIDKIPQAQGVKVNVEEK